MDSAVERAAVIAWLRKGGWVKQYDRPTLCHRLKCAWVAFITPNEMLTGTQRLAALGIERGDHLAVRTAIELDRGQDDA